MTLNKKINCAVSKVKEFKKDEKVFYDISIIDKYSGRLVGIITFNKDDVRKNTNFDLYLNLDDLDNWSIKTNIISISINTDKKLTKEDIDNHFEKWKLENKEVKDCVIFDYLIDRQRDDNKYVYLVKTYETYK